MIVDLLNPFRHRRTNQFPKQINIH